jgi:hypothetical protein
MAVDPRVYNERGEVVGGYLTPEEARNMGLDWKPRPNEPAPYRTEAETQAAGVAYVSEAEHYRRVGGNYNYGSDAFRLEELKSLVSGKLTTDQVVIPDADSSIVRSLVSQYGSTAANVLTPPAPPAPPSSSPSTGAPAPPGTSLVPVYPGSPGAITSPGLWSSSFAPTTSPTTFPTMTATGVGTSAPGTILGLPPMVVLIAVAVGAYLYMSR